MSLRLKAILVRANSDKDVNDILQIGKSEASRIFHNSNKDNKVVELLNSKFGTVLIIQDKNGCSNEKVGSPVNENTMIYGRNTLENNAFMAQFELKRRKICIESLKNELASKASDPNETANLELGQLCAEYVDNLSRYEHLFVMSTVAREQKDLQLKEQEQTEFLVRKQKEASKESQRLTQLIKTSRRGLK